MIVQSFIRICVMALGLTIVSTVAGMAQGAAVSLGVGSYDKTKPVEITSEELSVDQRGGTATFTGNVIVGQGDMRMTCQLLKVEYGPDPVTGRNEIQVINMSGGVTFVGKDEAAEADRAVYTLSSGILVMFDNVLVTQGATVLSSDKMTYNLNTGDGVMEGRVKTILQPSAKP